MNNDINEKIVHAAPVPPFVRFVASAVPMVFDNSLSYYECLCALWKWMQDNLVDVINNNATVTEHYIDLDLETRALFNQLKTYVDTYFDNLDVQDEINNKLDEMAEAGTLQEIITAYIQANVAWTFDTVADMKAATNLVNGSYAQTLGFHTVNDGGSATYYITNTGTANEMDVIAVGSLLANLILNKTYVKPEQLGAIGDGNHDATDIIQYGIDTYNSVELQGKYLISDTLRIHDKRNGFFGGETPYETEYIPIKSSMKIGLICSNMNTKACLSVCGCLNYQIKNFGICSDSTVDVDGPCVGIYYGRSSNHLSSQWNHIKGIACILGDVPTANNNNGTIGLYNNAAEEFSIDDCSFRCNNGIVHTDRDCMNLASLGNNFNYEHATCSVINHHNLVFLCENAFTLSKVNSMTFDNISYANVDNYLNPVVLRANFTNSPSCYWTYLNFRGHAEQGISNLKAFDFSTGVWDTYHFDECNITLFAINSTENNYVKLNSTYTGVLSDNIFDIKDNQSRSNAVMDFTAYNVNLVRSMFLCKGAVKLKNALSCFVKYFNTNDAAWTGAYGGSNSSSVNFPFSVCNRAIGASYTQPTANDVKEGSICICTNAGSNVAFWIYKNSTWKPVNIDT